MYRHRILATVKKRPKKHTASDEKYSNVTKTKEHPFATRQIFTNDFTICKLGGDFVSPFRAVLEIQVTVHQSSVFPREWLNAALEYG